MRITFILPSLSKVGGTRAVFEISNRLIDRGHEVTIIYPLFFLKYNLNSSGKFFIRRILSGIKNLIKGEKIDWFDLKAKLVRVPSVSPKLINFFKNQIPDADIIAATSWETVYSVNRLEKQKGIKTYFVQHYEAWDVWDSQECWNIAEKLESNAEKISLAVVDVVPENKKLAEFKKKVDDTYKLPFKKITTSLWLKELIENKLKERVEGAIGIGHNFNTFSLNSFDKKEKNSKKMILMPWRRIKWKGDEDGIKALKIVKKEFPEIRVVFFDTKRDEIIPEWVDFYSNPSQKELKELYLKADIFLMPSWVEGWSSPPMEAMACGTALVSTKVGGVPEYTINGKNAILAPAKDPKFLAEAMIELLKNEEKRLEIAKSGYEYIKQFTWDGVVDKLENILNNLHPVK
jgi:glycosyltransferase involved in cell wall biosynthesis